MMSIFSRIDPRRRSAVVCLFICLRPMITSPYILRQNFAGLVGVNRIACGIALTALLCGCAAPHVYRNTAGEAAPEQFLMECARLATRGTIEILGSFEGALLKASMTRECLAMKGYAQQS